MIVLNLCCDKDHRFEGWFASAEAFDAQIERGLLTCPSCGAHDIRKLPSAPYVQRGAREAEATAVPAKPAENAMELLLAKLREGAAKSEDVGERFPEEARRIHYGDAEDRAIKGKASLDDMASLLEEGIGVLPVPPAKEDLH